MTATDRAPAMTEAEAFLRHAECLDRAAADPEATPRVAAYLRIEASLARIAASSVAGLVPAVPETEETTK